jgi:hypothetical protein
MRNPLDLGSPKARLVRPKEGILDEFLSLSSATPARICSFAEKYGPLVDLLQVEAKVEPPVVIEKCEVWSLFRHEPEGVVAYRCSVPDRTRCRW